MGSTVQNIYEMMEETPLPEFIPGKITVKIGLPRSDKRKKACAPIFITINTLESLNLLSTRIKEKLPVMNNVSIPETLQIYFMKKSGAPQSDFIILTQDNFQEHLKYINQRYASGRRRGSMIMELFLYLEEVTSNTTRNQTATATTLRRATVARVQEAAQQLDDHFQQHPELPRPGRLEEAHLRIHNARQQENVPLEFPNNALTNQLRSLDQMRGNSSESDRVVNVRILLQGTWFTIGVNASDLRQVWLSDIEDERRDYLTNQDPGIRVNQRDVDHEDSEDDSDSRSSN